MFVHVRFKSYRSPDQIVSATFHPSGATARLFGIPPSLYCLTVLAACSMSETITLGKGGHAAHCKRCLIALPFSQVEIDPSRCASY